MRKNIPLEKEVDRTINKFNSVKRLPSAFSKVSSKQGLDNTDKILILVGILVFLFFFSRIIFSNMENWAYNKLSGTSDIQCIKEKGYRNHCFLINSSIILDNNIQIEEGEDG